MKANKMFLFGLDHAGKTAIVGFLKTGKIVETIPTLSFNIRTIKLKDDTELQIWDAPGQRNLRRIWNNGFNKAKVLLYIVDTSDAERFAESKKELENVLLEDDCTGLTLIVCFHKMDKDESKVHIEEAINFYKLDRIQGRTVEVLRTSIFDADSMNELLQVLTKDLGLSQQIQV